MGREIDNWKRHNTWEYSHIPLRSISAMSSPVEEGVGNQRKAFRGLNEGLRRVWQIRG